MRSLRKGKLMLSSSLLGDDAFSMPYHAPRVEKDAAHPTWWQGLVKRMQHIHPRLTAPDQATNATAEPIATPVRLTLPQRLTAKQNLFVAAATLGVAATSKLLYPPLQLACLPAFLYLGAAPAQSAYQSWRREEQLTEAIAESALLALCIVNGSFLVGSLGFSIYYLGKAMADRADQPKRNGAGWQPPLWAWRQANNTETVTLVGCIQAGDTIVVHAGEMIPVAGVVTTGTAWVRCQGASAAMGDGALAGVKVDAGHAVTVGTIVLVGTLYITVTPPQP